MITTLILNRDVGVYFEKNRGYERTKVLSLEIKNGETNYITASQPTTWASLMRIALTTMRPLIDKRIQKIGPEKFELDFNCALEKVIKFCGAEPNGNFSTKLFTDNSFIKSSIYLKSQNNKLPVIQDIENYETKYICAVYAGEVIWVLNAIVETLNLDSENDVWLEVEYVPREDLEERCDNPEDTVELTEAEQELINNCIELNKTLKKMEMSVIKLGLGEILLERYDRIQ